QAGLTIRCHKGEVPGLPDRPAERQADDLRCSGVEPRRLQIDGEPLLPAEPEEEHLELLGSVHEAVSGFPAGGAVTRETRAGWARRPRLPRGRRPRGTSSSVISSITRTEATMTTITTNAISGVIMMPLRATGIPISVNTRRGRSRQGRRRRGLAQRG